MALCMSPRWFKYPDITRALDRISSDFLSEILQYLNSKELGKVCPPIV